MNRMDEQTLEAIREEAEELADDIQEGQPIDREQIRSMTADMSLLIAEVERLETARNLWVSKYTDACDKVERLQEENERKDRLFEDFQAHENEVLKENERLKWAFEKAKSEAREYGAGKADEDIPDDDKEEAYRLGADDMLEDFLEEYGRALEGSE